ncbi:ATP-binding protein [Methylomonas methanica]|uniref:histidine kinase n=1 Tax=Methylomonas methanica (strain DSM 25384 / MC09) TaxID=857087 RepID=G0A3C6_METMM|nr:ATP-binding protein [Methylomonas methanica]AEG00225.1 integral membrane sensor signal transduction histidine kinase [Methylomonas methanica MC09]
MSIKPKRTIFLRVFLFFAFLVLAITLFFAFMVIPMQKTALQQIMYTQAETVSKSIVQATSDAIISKDFGFIVEHNVEVLKNNVSIHYLIVSPKQGEKIFINQRSWHMLNSFDDRISALQSDHVSFKVTDFYNIKDVYHFVYPIQFSGIEWGWLHIGFSTSEYDKYIHDMYYQIIYIISASLVLIIVVGYFFARWISGPVSAISQLATQVAAGDLTVRSTIRRDDEIGALSDSFNKMIDAMMLSNQYLEHYNQQLESEVTKRTQELADLNVDLDKKIKEEVVKSKRQEALLIHQSRSAAMGEMIGAIAHQWRQPLNALGLVLQNLQLRYRLGKLDDDFMRTSMEKSDRLVHKMSTTIDDFRNFFKPNKQVEPFNLKQVIQSTSDLLEAQLKSHNILVNIKCVDDLIINGLEGEFSQVILNLINNAKDALMQNKPTQPVIDIIAYGKGDGDTVVIVKDNAGGIPDAILDKIYDPYFTTKEEGKGTGIGLYMSKIIIENNMQGSLNAFNDADGANFVIELKSRPIVRAKPII